MKVGLPRAMHFYSYGLLWYTFLEQLGVKVVLICGAGGGKIAPIADVAICLPETETYKIQELTLPVYHTLCLMLEDHFFAG